MSKYPLPFDTEQWRSIAGMPYAVSSRGRVKRTTGGSNSAKPGRILKSNTDKDGYKIVRLSVDGVVCDRKIHRLVCEAFNGPSPFLDAQVRHFDGNPGRNRPGNLFWGTALDNADDRNRHGRTCKGASSPRAILSTKQANEIRRRHAEALSGRKRVPRGMIPLLAKEFGMSRHGIATIVSGKGYQ